jgi:hypothetical protein
MRSLNPRRKRRDFFDSQAAASLQWAKVMLPEVLRLYRPASIIDIACGIDCWLRAAGELGSTNPARSAMPCCFWRPFRGRAAQDTSTRDGPITGMRILRATALSVSTDCGPGGGTSCASNFGTCKAS